MNIEFFPILLAVVLLAAGVGEVRAITWTTLDHPGAVETSAFGAALLILALALFLTFHCGAQE